MTERHLDLLQKHRELQKAFDDTLEMNRKLGSENWKFEKENEQLKARIERMKCCGNCFHHNKPSDKEFCWNCERQLDERPIIKDEWEIAE